LNAPLFGSIKIDTVYLSQCPPRAFHNIYITQTQGCETLGTKGLCKKQVIEITYQQFVFDDLTPPPPPIIPPPNNNPCDNLPTDIRGTFIQEAQAACARVIDQSKSSHLI
jgi:hypothetical protein